MLRRIALLAALLPASGANADDYLRGYAQGLLDARFENIATEVLTVTDGHAVLRARNSVTLRQRQALERALNAAADITRVEWCGPPCAPAQALKDSQRPAAIAKDEGALPAGELFPPLLADPRQPRFAAHYQAHQIPDTNFNAGLATLGDYFPLARTDTRAGRLEVGVQAGIFSLFNLDAESLNLINTDFVIGFPLSYRRGAVSARAQVYHQSSHLGDEFLLGNPNVQRINLSYEDAELLLAYDLPGVRVYGGGGYIFSANPDLDPAHWQTGLEARWPGAIGEFDLVGAGDLQGFEQQDWEVNQSYQLGLAWRQEGGRELRLMLERFDGLSPNGQFFDTPLNFWGFGLFFDL